MKRRTVILLLLAMLPIALLQWHRHIAAPVAGPANADVAVELRSLTATPPPDKAWAANFAGFSAAHPGDWIIGRCDGPFLSQAEAETSARADAARAVYVQVMQQLGDDQRDIANDVMKDIQSGKLQVDMLSEKFDRSYGTVWTESVLLDASKDKLDQLLAPYRHDLQAKQNRVLLTRLAAIALTISAWAVCLLLNVLTKGYFTLRLEVVAATITVLAAFVAL